MTVERALRILGRGYTHEEARRLVVACGLLLDAAESALGGAGIGPSAATTERGPLPCPAGGRPPRARDRSTNPCEP